MSGEQLDATVSGIIDDLTAGASLPWPEACFKFSRAVHALRMTAFNTESVITGEQQEALDAAIRVAQPVIVCEPASADLKCLVCSLHAVTAEWAKRSRNSGAPPSLNLLEACIMARMLDNWLDSANLMNALDRKRAEMAPEQRRWLGELVQELYPSPISAASVEPMPFHDQRTVH